MSSYIKVLHNKRQLNLKVLTHSPDDVYRWTYTKIAITCTATIQNPYQNIQTYYLNNYHTNPYYPHIADDRQPGYHENTDNHLCWYTIHIFLRPITLTYLAHIHPLSQNSSLFKWSHNLTQKNNVCHHSFLSYMKLYEINRSWYRTGAAIDLLRKVPHRNIHMISVKNNYFFS